MTGDRYTDLYRAYDEAGRLLYIGISFSCVRRADQHRQNSKWFRLLATFKVEKHPTREAALVAERQAIQAEKPIYNVSHNRALNPPKRQMPQKPKRPATGIVIGRKQLDQSLFTKEEREILLSAVRSAHRD